MTMTSEALVVVCESAISATFLLVFAVRLAPCFRLDEFRQAVFIVRDELFDFALAGRVSFEDPAYRLLRQSMNGFIRYAHQLTFFRLMCTLLTWKARGEQPALTWAARWETALQNTNPETAKELKQFHSRALALVVKRLVTGSPVLMLALGAMILVAIFQTQWVGIKQVVMGAAAETVNRIIGTGLIEEEAAKA